MYQNGPDPHKWHGQGPCIGICIPAAGSSDAARPGLGAQSLTQHATNSVNSKHAMNNSLPAGLRYRIDLASCPWGRCYALSLLYLPRMYLAAG